MDTPNDGKLGNGGLPLKIAIFGINSLDFWGVKVKLYFPIKYVIPCNPQKFMWNINHVIM